MATWHQQQSGCILYDVYEYTIVCDPPNDVRTLQRFFARSTAEDCLARWHANGKGQHCYILDPVFKPGEPRPEVKVRVHRECMGYYRAYFHNLCFNLVRREDGQWYFANSRDAEEGGDDLYRTKKETVGALESYLRTRHWNEQLKCYCG